MLISLLILPIYLLLVHSVTSADLFRNKEVPRRRTELTRTYDFNHPPIVDSYDNIPVTVIYDNQEVIKVRSKNVQKADVTVEDEKKYLKHPTNDRKALNLDALPENYPPSRNLFPFSVVKDHEEELNLKPNSPSIKLLVTESNEKKAPEITSAELKTRTENKSRRRTQHVRKLKVDKNHRDVYFNETDITKSKVAQKEVTRKINQTRINEPSLPIPKTFQRRNQVRDPVVPIIESENYVFSHSGNFHYSYESGDGTKAYERGELKSLNGGAGSSVEGNFSYRDNDGNDFSLSYTADEKGYRPVGVHLPTPPPIPPAIQRALDYLATKTTPEPITERIKPL